MTTKPVVKRLNHRHKQVALNQATGMNQTDSYLAVYGCDYETAGKQSYLLNTKNPLFKAYLNELIERKATMALTQSTETIMQPHEVKVRLTELARANLIDFIDEEGKPRISKDIPHNSAIKKYYRKRKTDRQGNGIDVAEIALHDQIEALRELAKIHGMYAPSKHLVAKKVQFDINMVEKGKMEED